MFIVIIKWILFDIFICRLSILVSSACEASGRFFIVEHRELRLLYEKVFHKQIELNRFDFNSIATMHRSFV